MREYELPILTDSYVSLFINAEGKLDVDRLVEVQRLPQPPVPNENDWVVPVE